MTKNLFKTFGSDVSEDREEKHRFRIYLFLRGIYIQIKSGFGDIQISTNVKPKPHKTFIGLRLRLDKVSRPTYK